MRKREKYLLLSCKKVRKFQKKYIMPCTRTFWSMDKTIKILKHTQLFKMSVLKVESPSHFLKIKEKQND